MPSPGDKGGAKWAATPPGLARAVSDPLEAIWQSPLPRAMKMLLNSDLDATRWCRWRQAAVERPLQTVGSTKGTSHHGGRYGEGQEGASKREICSWSLGMRPYLEKKSFTVIKLSS